MQNAAFAHAPFGLSGVAQRFLADLADLGRSQAVNGTGQAEARLELVPEGEKK